VIFVAHVAQWKFKEVEELKTILIDNKIIGIVEIGGIPAPQIQHMRKNLYGNAILRSSKNTLISRAIDEAGKKIKGLESLKKEISGQAAIIATDINPFKLYSQIKSTRTMAPARGGEIATYDIEIKAGDTPFKPGPIVGELQKVGIPAAIKEGKVVIKNDKVIVPSGGKISKEVAQMLTRLEIFPIKIGMTLNAVFEEGNIFKQDVLDIDIDVFRSNIIKASNNAINLAVNSAWVNNKTINILLSKAHKNAFTISIERSIITKQTLEYLMIKARRSMMALAHKSNDAALDKDLKK
jgi:large subunit ribosomal protein L10